MKRSAILLLLSALLLSSPLLAIVNMESLHTGAPEEGFSGTLEASYKSKSGNSERVDYALGSRLQWHRGDDTTFLLLNGEYGKAAGIEYSRKAFSHLRHIHQFTPVVAGEAFLQAEFDDFTRLESRRLAGGGARFTLYSGAQGTTLHLGTGLFHEYERIDAKYPDGGTEERNRGNLYLVVKLPLGEHSTLVSSSYYQPDLADSGDYRVLEQAALRTTLTSRLSLILAVDHRYDSRPPLGLGERDTSVNTSIAFTF